MGASSCPWLVVACPRELKRCPRPQSLDDVIKDLMAAIHRELAEKQSLSFSMAFPPNKVELSTTKADGTESFIFEFPNPDARLGFEQAFEDAKKKLGNTRDRGGGCGWWAQHHNLTLVDPFPPSLHLLI